MVYCQEEDSDRGLSQYHDRGKVLRFRVREQQTGTEKLFHFEGCCNEYIYGVQCVAIVLSGRTRTSRIEITIWIIVSVPCP